MAAEGSGNEPVRIEGARFLSKPLQFIVRDETIIADVVFISEVQVPIAMRFERADESANRRRMGRVIRNSPSFFRTGNLSTGEGDIDYEPAAITFGD